MSRRFDVVVFGATGFTGRLVAKYLAERYGVGGAVRWAIAGRNLGKLESLRAELGRLGVGAAQVPVVEADSADRRSLEALCGEAQVVISAVGPYASYGSELVGACVERGADYCDLTGETPWIRSMIQTHHERAREQGLRIVHCCGFDSVPSDLGVWAMQGEALRRHGAPLKRIALYLERSRGGVSGGTIASMLQMLADADGTTRRVLSDPYALNPVGSPRGPDGPDQRRVEWDEELGTWTAPFVMAVINTRVVRRTNAVLGFPWGTDFSYRESVALPTGPPGWAMGQAMTWGLGLLMWLGAMKPTRRLLEATVLPSPGEGPRPELVESGYFRMRMVGSGEDRRGRPTHLEGRILGKRDPGYGATSRMLTEAALALALERERLPGVFGVLTPAAAMGDVLLERLGRADVRIEVD